MKLSEEERQAIMEALDAGARWGYGNLISYLQTAWRLRLMDAHGMDEAAARLAAGGVGYPTAMFHDLLERGEWDETGKRYRQAPKRNE